MAFSRNLMYVCGGLMNFGLFGYGVKQGKANNDWFQRQPPDKQREIYNKCPLQKYGSSGDAISAIYERQAYHSSEQQTTPPNKPFDEAYPKNKIR